jgi:hypothetical protein
VLNIDGSVLLAGPPKPLSKEEREQLERDFDLSVLDEPPPSLFARRISRYFDGKLRELDSKPPPDPKPPRLKLVEEQPALLEAYIA